MQNALKILFLAFSLILPNILKAGDPDNAAEKKLKLKLDSAINLMDMGRYPEARILFNEVGEKILLPEFKALAPKYYYNHGMLLFHLWELKEAEPFLENALDLFRESADTAGIVAAYAGLGSLKAEQELYRESIFYQETARKLVNDIDSLRYYGLTANLALAYEKSGQFDKALEYHLQAKDFYTQVAHLLNLALVENNLGELYRNHFGNSAIARKHYLNAIALNKKLNHKQQLAANYLNLSLLFNKLNQRDSALYYIGQSSDLRAEIGDHGGQAIVSYSLGEIYRSSKNYDEAVAAYNRAINISLERNIPPGIYYGHTGLGQVYEEMGALVKSRKSYLNALEQARDINSLPMLISAHENLYNFERKRGEFKEALEHFEEFNALKDSVSSRQNTDRLAELKVIYETELANSENEILRSEKAAGEVEMANQRLVTIGLWLLLIFLLVITLILVLAYRRKVKNHSKEKELRSQLEEQNARLEEQKQKLNELNKMKNNIFSVIGHDLRAPLINISNLIDLFANKEVSNEELEGLMKHLGLSARSSLKSLQSILEWSRMEFDSSELRFEKVDLNQLVDEVEEAHLPILQSKNLKIERKIDNSAVLYADENQLKSILMNLVHNAAKFSFEGKPIIIQTRKGEEGTYLEIKDFGKGISPANLTQLNGDQNIVSSRGTYGESGTGIGLSIVKQFVQLHKGKLRFQAGEKEGTVVSVYFPVQQANELKESSRKMA